MDRSPVKRRVTKCMTDETLQGSKLNSESVAEAAINVRFERWSRTFKVDNYSSSLPVKQIRSFMVASQLDVIAGKRQKDFAAGPPLDKTAASLPANDWVIVLQHTSPLLREACMVARRYRANKYCRK